jgi:hypothetical protein
MVEGTSGVHGLKSVKKIVGIVGLFLGIKINDRKISQNYMLKPR